MIPHDLFKPPVSCWKILKGFLSLCSDHSGFGLCHLLSLLKILNFDILLQYNTFYDTFAGGPKATFLPSILHAIFVLLSSMHYRNQSSFLLFFSLFIHLFACSPACPHHPPPRQDIVGYYLNPFQLRKVWGNDLKLPGKDPKKPQMKTTCNILGTLMA